MNGPCWLLCWTVAGFILWEVPIGSLCMPSTNDGDKVDGDKMDGDKLDREKMRAAVGEESGDCIPPTNSSTPMGLRGFQFYFANDSLIGRPVPCTREDKICFRHNLIFNPMTDRCEPLWKRCGAGNTLTVVNRTELERGSGRVVSSCPVYDSQCSGYIMAFDGACYQKKIVRDIICGCNATHTRHILGGVECRVARMTPSIMQQPEEDGSCVIPDLQNPHSRRSMLLDDPFNYGYSKELKCTSNQATCFSEGKVFVAGHEGCHILLEQGPCAEDHVVALDFQAASKGRAEGTCVHTRGGCPKGYKRMAFDGECHEDREIQIEAPGNIVLDEYGRYVVTWWGWSIPFNAQFDGNQKCKIQIPATLYTYLPPNPLSPLCGTDDSGKCRHLEVVNTSPIPIL